MKKRYIMLMFFIVVAMWATSWYLIPKWYNRAALEAGTFGDMFGAVNALFSGLAFAGLIYTISVQREELKEQRKAIGMQTNELELQRQAIEMQTKELSLQTKAIEMQITELENQKLEMVRTANELEDQKKLMNFQTILNTLNGMLSVKKDAKQRLGNNKGETYFLEILQGRNYRKIKEAYRTNLNDYLSIFLIFFNIFKTLVWKKAKKKELAEIVFINTSSQEYQVILLFSEEHQHRNMLLKSVDFEEKIKAREFSKYGIDH